MARSAWWWWWCWCSNSTVQHGGQILTPIEEGGGIFRPISNHKTLAHIQIYIRDCLMFIGVFYDNIYKVNVVARKSTLKNI